MDPVDPSQKRGEKGEEKEREKGEEKGQNLDEKYRRNPVGFVGFTVLIIWLGVVLLLQNLEVIADDDRGWAVFAWGAGAILLAQALVRLATPRWRTSVLGTFVWAAILVGVGFGLWFEAWELAGPIVIIAVGVAILAGRFLPRR